MKQSLFYDQARAMLQVLPLALREPCFALKGGTAINFFYRDMPRLSVDIDLTYLPLHDRETSLKEMGLALERIATSIETERPQFAVKRIHPRNSHHLAKLDAVGLGQRIRIEPNLIIRGAVFGTATRPLSPRGQEEFGLTLEARTLTLAELYGGKICAALDRQHPRDLYDIHLLLIHEGITEEIRRAFVVYLAGHDRPMAELLDPIRKDMRQIYGQEFSTMVVDEVKYEILEEARETLIRSLRFGLTDPERSFLISIKEGKPDWKLLDIPGLDRWPSIQWKLLNIGKMGPSKHREALARLKKILG